MYDYGYGWGLALGFLHFFGLVCMSFSGELFVGRGLVGLLYMCTARSCGVITLKP